VDTELPSALGSANADQCASGLAGRASKETKMVIEYGKAEDVKPADIQPHYLANLFPMMDEPDLAELVRDIERFGQREPIVLLDNKILDGRNRFKACLQLGITPKFREYHGNDPIGFVVSLNLKRRHLTTSQRAMVAARIANLAVGSNQHVHRLKQDNMTGEEFSPPMTVTAKTMKIDRKTGQAAKTVLSTGHVDLIAAVDQGEISVSAAAIIAKEPKDVQQLVMTPSQDKELSTALKRLQNAKAQDDEADKFVPPDPLSEDEKAERERIFGTREVRSFLSKVLTTSEIIPTLPSPEDLARSVPAAMENIITDNINAMREVSKWFDAFATAWQAKE
jgi:hypothetical protein